MFIKLRFGSCIKKFRNRCSSGINLSKQLHQQRHPSSGKLFWLNVEVEEFPRIVQLYTVQPRRIVEEMSNCCGFLDQSCSFPVCELMFQFPITSFWQDCPLCVAFKSPRLRSTLRCPNSPHKMRSGWNAGSPLVDTWLGRQWRIFERTPIQEDRTQSFVMRATTDARWVRLILHISW